MRISLRYAIINFLTASDAPVLLNLTVSTDARTQLASAIYSDTICDRFGNDLDLWMCYVSSEGLFLVV